MRKALFGVVLWSVLVLCLACSGSGEADDIATALADRLTDALNFDGGSIQEGDAPAAVIGDPSVPQILGASFPVKLAPASEFTVNITSDFTDPSQVKGAVLQVEGDARHILIEAPFTDYAMNLNGFLEQTAQELVGKTFKIRVALLSTSGRAGAYAEWILQIREAAEMSFASCSWMAKVNKTCGEISYVCHDLEDAAGSECTWDACPYLDPDGAARVVEQTCNRALNRTFAYIDEEGVSQDSGGHDVAAIQGCTDCATAAEAGRCTASETVVSTSEQWNILSDFMAPECQSSCKLSDGTDLLATLWAAIGSEFGRIFPQELETDPACD